MSSKRYGTLDGLRGIAAFVVLIGHLSGPFRAIVPHGYLAVDLFFLMSGFVVASAYEQKLKQDWSIARFIAVRLKRLWPLYLLSFVVGITCYLIARELKPSDNFLFPPLPLSSVVAMGVLFLPQLVLYGGGAAFPLNPAAWSLSTEIFGNIGYGAIARTVTKRTLLVISGIGLVGLIVIVARTGWLNVGADVRDLSYSYIRFCFSFPLGVVIYRLHAEDRLPRPRMPSWILVAAAGLAMSGVVPMLGIFDLFSTVILFPLILIAAVSNQPPSRASRMFAWAGAISYPLYCLHEPVTGLILTVVPYGTFHVVLLMCLPPVFVLAAHLADIWFDRPVQKWLAALTDLRPAEARS
jgi:peptidoglycan/LPS O-acetylase OafA/YrhL